MNMIDILLIAGIALGLVCMFLILRGSKKQIPKDPAKAAEAAIAAAVAEAARAGTVAEATKAGTVAEATKAGSVAEATKAAPAEAAKPVSGAPGAEPVAEPTAGATSPFLPAADGTADDLSKIKGIGPKLSARLAELGVFHYRQIAGWSPSQLAQVDAQLGNFAGRPERDQWQSQAHLLAEGDVKAYERVHGKLGPAA